MYDWEWVNAELAAGHNITKAKITLQDPIVFGSAYGSLKNCYIQWCGDEVEAYEVFQVPSLDYSLYDFVDGVTLILITCLDATGHPKKIYL